MISFLLCSCSTLAPRSSQNAKITYERPPANLDNICSIFREKRHWIDSARTSYNKWKFPVESMMAIIYHESSFQANARPRNSQGKLRSSAYGYAQGIDGTWRQFQRETRRWEARRYDFDDAIYFVGWYLSKTISRNKELSPYDIASQYVFYHDGWDALPDDRSRTIKKFVLRVATKVHKKTLVYHKQLKRCSLIANRLYLANASNKKPNFLPQRKTPRKTKSWF